MEIKKLAESLNPAERKVLKVIADFNSFSDLMKSSELKDIELMRALHWLQNKNIVKINEEQKEFVSLDENGQKYLKYGLPERIFLEALDKPLTLEELNQKSGMSSEEITISLGVLKSKAAIEIKKGDKISNNF